MAPTKVGIEEKENSVPSIHTLISNSIADNKNLSTDIWNKTNKKPPSSGF